MIVNFHHTPIFYKVSGTGPALVLLHGFLESSTIWKELARAFSETRTVITIDLPGHGKSGLLAPAHSMELMAEAVHAVLQELDINTATFMGHSMGGYVVMAYTELYQNEVQALILLNSSPAEDSLDRKINRDRAIEVIKNNSQAFISMAISNLFAETSREFYAAEIEALKTEASAFPVEGIIAAIKGMKDRKDRVQVLKNFSRTKIMICGKEDPISTLKDIKKIAEATHSQLKIVEGGHMSWLEKPSEIKEIIHFID